MEPFCPVSGTCVVRLRIADDRAFRDVAGEPVLVNVNTGTYLGKDGHGRPHG